MWQFILEEKYAARVKKKCTGGSYYGYSCPSDTNYTMELGNGYSMIPGLNVYWVVLLSCTEDAGVLAGASVNLIRVTGKQKMKVKFKCSVSLQKIDNGNVKYEAEQRKECELGPEGGLIHTLNLPHPVSMIEVVVKLYSRGQFDLNIGDDYRRLFEKSLLSDIVLQVGGKGEAKRDIPAHKAVLAARSPVLQALLLSNMAESQTNSITVNFSADAVEHLLRYMYTGRLESCTCTESATESETEPASEAKPVNYMALLEISDYYEISGLKNICEDNLAQQALAEPERALETLVLADRYRAHGLKHTALNVAADHVAMLMERPEWEDFTHHCHLMSQLMLVLVTSKLK